MARNTTNHRGLKDPYKDSAPSEENVNVDTLATTKLSRGKTGPKPRQPTLVSFAENMQSSPYRAAQTDGEGGVLQIPNDILAGHHRRSEGSCGTPRGTARRRQRNQRGTIARLSSSQENFKIKDSAPGTTVSVDEPTDKKGVQGCHNGRETKKPGETKGTRQNTPSEEAQETKNSRRPTKGAQRDGLPEAGRRRQETT